MIRWISRILGLGLMVGAFAAGIIDGARSIGIGKISLTPMGATTNWAAPKALPWLEAFLSKHDAAFVWDPLMLGLLMAPTFAALAVVGALLLLVASRRRRSIGFSSRER